MSEMTFRKTLRMEHAIAENDRTVRGTPVENCIFQKPDFGTNKNRIFLKQKISDPSLLSALLGLWYATTSIWMPS